MSDLQTIIKDKREIKYVADGLSFSFRVGRGDCAKIVPYHENGEMAPVVWLAVYNAAGVVTNRINASRLAVIRYAEE